MLKNENSCRWGSPLDSCCKKNLRSGTLKEALRGSHQLFGTTENASVLFLKCNRVAY